MTSVSHNIVKAKGVISAYTYVFGDVKLISPKGEELTVGIILEDIKNALNGKMVRCEK